MVGQNGVADREGALPGTVLEPNTATQDLNLTPDPLSQFGTELQKPAGPDAGKKTDPDAQRFEYWQSQAQQAQAKAQQLEAELAKRKPLDPLVDLVRSDEVSYRFLQERLKGGSTQPEKPLEPPQKPDSYNEVEAYSNPESASFKYRQQKEEYKDKLLSTTLNQLKTLEQRQQEEKRQMEEEHARQQGLRQFRAQVVQQGLADEEFAEFFEFINGGAKPDELVKAYQLIRKGQAATPGNQFAVIPPSSVGGRPQAQAFDFGKEAIAESRRM